MTKILIISALAEEMAPITHSLGLTEMMQVWDIVEHDGYIFAVSAVGKVSAAMMLTKVLEQFEVTAIINIGLAGSLVPHLTFGDVVIVEHTVEHDGIIEGDEEAQKRLYPLFQLTTIEHPELKRWVLVTGDQFINSQDIKEVLQSKGGQLVDMEGAALAKVAHHYGIPLVALKVISDHADESAGNDFETNLHAGERVVKHLPFILGFLSQT